jgi:hypothetical protein
VAELGGYMSLFLGVSCMNLYSVFARMRITIKEKWLVLKQMQNTAINSTAKKAVKK